MPKLTFFCNKVSKVPQEKEELITEVINFKNVAEMKTCNKVSFSSKLHTEAIGLPQDRETQMITLLHFIEKEIKHTLPKKPSMVLDSLK